MANLFRGFLSFVTGIIIARNLGPEQYGNFSFLLGTFIAVRQLLDMGTSSAFYTFIAKKKQPGLYIVSYFAWQAMQFVLVVGVIILILPREWFETLWGGHEKQIVITAFTAVFMQQQVWQTVLMIAESRRLTYVAQLLNLGISAGHLMLVSALVISGEITIEILFYLIVGEYLAGMIIAYKLLGGTGDKDKIEFDFKKMLSEYLVYCTPLVIYMSLGFLYEFADKWLLQNFGGAVQQGFYGISYQFASVSLIATMSMLKIFWKEMAEAKQNENLERMKSLYRKTSRFLFFIGGFISGLLIPWSGEIVKLTLGAPFIAGTTALAIMFLYPLHQSMGQIGGTMLLATGQTKAQTMLGVIFMSLSMPATYFVLAPNDSIVPGLGMGANGMAIKMVVMNILNVNLIAWWISKYFKWDFDWFHQFYITFMVLAVGYFAYYVANGIVGVESYLILRVAISIIVYSLFIGIITWKNPASIGFAKEEIRIMFFNIFSKINKPGRDVVQI
ncbi:MAG: lipopolysaccharide biosynthesis protein [Nitrospinota bacterium]|nr:lipopolysaccharide biosynthesis protein [Nitrospinota bacterium]